jgi:radical SAM protein with 4Fe4S-binding SPASM domain
MLAGLFLMLFLAPCRRLPIKIGNLYEKTLEEIYYSPLYERFRRQEDIDSECRSCSNFHHCFGGAKCVTLALTGKTTPDVQCWKFYKENAYVSRALELYEKIISIFKIRR